MASELYEKQRRYNRKKTAEGSDIGELPAVANPARRERCRLDLLAFLTTYYPASTGLKPFSPDHHRVIARIQQCALYGGRFGQAVFRGWAKTTIGENSMQWATFYGHRRFVALFGSDQNSGEGNIDSIQTELQENDLLLEDFPEICYPIRCLDGKPQRCAGQTYTVMVECPDCRGAGCEECEGVGKIGDRRPTRIEWTSDTIVLPSILGSAASGGIITARGITAGSRGMKHKRADGTQQRPDFVFIDDPQTDESAASPTQVQTRLKIIKKNILKLGGHGRPIAAVMAGTVIEPDDLVDQLLDPKKNPSWQSERIPMVRQWAEPDAHEKLWLGEYARLRTTFDPDDPTSQKSAHEAATEFYRQRRPEMDKGAKVSWEHCYDEETELSAIQHAYNIFIDDGPEVFAAECQNQPLVKQQGTTELKVDGVSAKAVRLRRGVLPTYASHITGFIDVQDKLLYGGLVGWAPGFRGHVVDYGTYPEQPDPYFSYRGAKNTLSRRFPGMSKESLIRAGLEAYVDHLAGRKWKREDGAEMSVGVILIDAGDGDHADIVYEFCQRSKFSHILRPSKGRYVGASNTPWEMYPKRAGEVLGNHWLVAPLPKRKSVRLTHFDTNYWKTFITNGFLAPLGASRGIELFDGPHKMLADHATSEYGVKTEGRGREVTEWKLRPGRDNHLFDVMVGCAVGASMLGVKVDIGMPQLTVRARKPRRSVSYL